MDADDGRRVTATEHYPNPVQSVDSSKGSKIGEFFGALFRA